MCQAARRDKQPLRQPHLETGSFRRCYDAQLRLLADAGRDDQRPGRRGVAASCSEETVLIAGRQSVPRDRPIVPARWLGPTTFPCKNRQISCDRPLSIPDKLLRGCRPRRRTTVSLRLPPKQPPPPRSKTYLFVGRGELIFPPAPQYQTTAGHLRHQTRVAASPAQGRPPLGVQAF